MEFLDANCGAGMVGGRVGTDGWSSESKVQNYHTT